MSREWAQVVQPLYSDMMQSWSKASLFRQGYETLTSPTTSPGINDNNILHSFLCKQPHGYKVVNTQIICYSISSKYIYVMEQSQRSIVDGPDR